MMGVTIGGSGGGAFICRRRTGVWSSQRCGDFSSFFQKIKYFFSIFWS